MADTNAVYTGAAMNFLEGYASDAYNNAETFLNDLHSFVAAEIVTTPPALTPIDTNPTISIDSSLSAEMPDAPDYGSDALPSDPNMLDHPFPVAPTYEIPTIPTLSNFTIPDFVDGAISSITTTMPVINFSVPSIANTEATQINMDSLFATIRERLESNILNGGTMLNPTVEADIWNRDLERDNQTLQDTMDKLAGEWGKLGFDAPDGLLAGSFIAVNNEHMNKRLDRSRGISIKQAELEHDGLFKSLELGLGFEKLWIDCQNEYARRVLETAKLTAETTIGIFKERINLYNTSLEAFKADLVAYKTSIEAEAVRAEVYRSKIMALQALAQVDETKIKAYVAQISAIGQRIEIYNTEVKSVAVMYEVEKQKIDMYRSRIDAYVAKIDGTTKKYLGQVEGYKSYVQAWIASADSSTKLIEMKSKIELTQLEVVVKEWEIQMKLAQEGINVKLEALKTVATVASNLAAGALSAIHASVSDSYSNSYNRTVYSDVTQI